MLDAGQRLSDQRCLVSFCAIRPPGRNAPGRSPRNPFLFTLLSRAPRATMWHRTERQIVRRLLSLTII